MTSISSGDSTGMGVAGACVPTTVGVVLVVAEGRGVAEGLGVLVGLAVRVGVFVSVGVRVIVGVFVLVGVRVGTVGAGVRVGVGSAGVPALHPARNAAARIKILSTSEA